jgi:hypothetical protein
MPNSDLPSKLYQDLFTHLHQPSTRRNSQMRNLTPPEPHSRLNPHLRHSMWRGHRRDRSTRNTHS